MAAFKLEDASRWTPPTPLPLINVTRGEGFELFPALRACLAPTTASPALRWSEDMAKLVKKMLVDKMDRGDAAASLGYSLLIGEPQQATRHHIPVMLKQGLLLSLKRTKRA